jgi:hypothetical protein
MASSGLIKSRERPRTKGGEKGEAEKEKREITERRLGRKTKKKQEKRNKGGEGEELKKKN